MTPIVELRDAVVRFPAGSALTARLRGREPPVVTALDRVSLAVEAGASVGIVGESGCGKSTLARALVGLVALSDGTVLVDGVPQSGSRARTTRRRVQMVFQDPSSSLNPARTVGQTLAELLRAHRLVASAGVRDRCHELLDLVQLPRSAMGARPRELSGGQRQRVGIARALALEPDVLIADEAVAALDVSVQALILNLLADLRTRLALTLICISHDLAVVRHVSDDLVVMYLGRIVESGRSDAVFADPRHPYTRALIAAAPQLHVRRLSGSAALPGEPPSPLNLPTGCRFAPRCPIAQEICGRVEPELLGGDEHRTACHLAGAAIIGRDAAGRAAVS